VKVAQLRSRLSARARGPPGAGDGADGHAHPHTQLHYGTEESIRPAHSVVRISVYASVVMQVNCIDRELRGRTESR